MCVSMRVCVWVYLCEYVWEYLCVYVCVNIVCM